MTMTEIGLLAFGVFLLLLIVLDVGMIVSLVRQGDERRQMIVWRTSTYTLLGASGALVLDIIENLVRSQPMAVNPFGFDSDDLLCCADDLQKEIW